MIATTTSTSGKREAVLRFGDAPDAQRRAPGARRL